MASPTTSVPATPKVVVACAGGGMRGAAQAGMLLELATRGIRFDAFTGVSTGAIQAGYLSQAPPAGQLAQAQALADLWSGLTAAPIAGGVVEAVLRLLFGKPSLHRADPLRALLARHITTPPCVPLEIGAASVHGGVYVGLRPTAADQLREAILASAAIPGLLPPVGERALVDGGVVHVAPLRPAFELANALWPPEVPVVVLLLHCLPLDAEWLPPKPGSVTGLRHAPLWKLAPRELDMHSVALERADLVAARRTNDVMALIAQQKQSGVMLPVPPSLVGKRWARLLQIAPAVGPGYSMLEFDRLKLRAYLSRGREAAGAVVDAVGWPPETRPVVYMRSVAPGRHGQIT